MVIETFRLDDINVRRRAQSLYGKVYAANQAATAAWHQKTVECQVARSKVFRQLQAHRALPCDDMRVVVSRYDDTAALGGICSAIATRSSRARSYPITVAP